MVEWYLKGLDGVSGPFTWEELRFLAARSKIGGEQAVAQRPEGPWTPADAAFGLRGASAVSVPREPSFANRVSAPVSPARKPPLDAEPSGTDGFPAAPPSSPPPLPPRPSDARRWMTAAGTLAAVLLFGLLLISLMRPLTGGAASSTGSGTAAADGDGNGASSQDGQDGPGSPTETPSDSHAGGGAQASRPESATAEPEAKGKDGTEATANEPRAQSAAPDADSVVAQKEGDASGEAVSPLPSLPRAAVIAPLDDDDGALVEEGGGRAAGTGDSAEFFQIRGQGRRFVYVVDCSGSMSGAPFNKACHELLESIRKLRSAQSFFVVFFDDREYPQFFPETARSMLRASPANKRRIGDWIKEFHQPGGGTAPEDALLRALALAPDAIYFLTDGAFDLEVAQLVRRRNGGQTAIHTVAFMDRSAEPLLKQIARENLGSYRFVP